MPPKTRPRPPTPEELERYRQEAKEHARRLEELVAGVSLLFGPVRPVCVIPLDVQSSAPVVARVERDEPAEPRFSFHQLDDVLALGRAALEKEKK